tara:strand:+ start:6395 stop:7726 length:1332 start_codon:yes stop_codon:yes gene_type:complete
VGDSMTQIAAEASYANQFADLQKKAPLPGCLGALRDDAFECFDRLGFPTRRLESWRFTNIAPIAETNFVQPTDRQDYTRNAFNAMGLPKLGGVEFVFLNGTYAPSLSTIDGLPDGLRVRSLGEVLDNDPDTVIPHLGRIARFEHQAFTALNTAFLRDGAVVEVPEGIVVGEPIHLIFITSSTGLPTLCQPRVLVIAGATSQVQVVESHVGTDVASYLNNAVTEVSVGDQATVDHYTIVLEGESAFRVGNLQASVGRASNFSSHTITLSGAIVRNEASVVLEGEGGECTLNGLYLASGRQLVDNQTTIDHARPHCDSHELYKGVLDGQSSAVFNGKIVVRLDAQKTDAKQSNKALLLSEDAQVTTKPQLEIFADDVKCTHGATVGQLDPDSLFYLRSRALSEQQARQVLIHAFAADLLGHIKVGAVRQQLDSILLDRLPMLSGS